MSSAELERVNAMLLELREQVPGSLPELRAEVDRRSASFAPPPGMQFEAVAIERDGAPTLSALWGRDTSRPARGTVVYLHGGGYVVGSAAGFRGLAGAIGVAAGADVLIVDYRLAPEHPFPAAVHDAVAACRWLTTTQGVAPAQLALAGDSAGAGLALAALLQLRADGAALPAAALLLSPWVDLALTGASVQTKAPHDLFLAPDLLRHLAQTYLGDAPATNALASPLHADLRGLPPLLIQVGSAEILLDDAIRLAGLAGACDVEVGLEVWPAMPHVWHGFAPVLQEGRDAIARAGSFLARRFVRPATR